MTRTNTTQAAAALATDRILSAYAEAFQACYHDKNVGFQKAKGNAYHVVINGDKGDITLNLSDLQEATRNLQR